MAGTASPREAGTPPAAPRWDPLVRITHWGVAAAVLLNGLITEGGGRIHIWIGYAALSLLVLRLIWGLAGTEETRFSAFAPSLRRARAHLADLRAGRAPPRRSHTPLGALMVYALWGVLGLVAITGIAMAGSPFASAPDGAATVAEGAAEGHDDDHEAGEGGEALEEIHEIGANLLLILAAVHVGGVALESRLSGRNLARDMVTGGGRR